MPSWRASSTSPTARPHRRPIGADLRPGRAELRRVGPERDDRVGALGLGLLDEALLRVSPSVDELLGHALQLSPTSDFNEAPICEPTLRERTVRPKTSPSTSSIS